MVLEHSWNVATAGKLRSWLAPATRGRVIAKNICWNSATREEVNADGVLVPFGCKNTSLVCIQASTVALRGLALDPTALVFVLTIGGNIAVGGAEIARELSRIPYRLCIQDQCGESLHSWLARARLLQCRFRPTWASLDR